MKARFWVLLILLVVAGVWTIYRYFPRYHHDGSPTRIIIEDNIAYIPVSFHEENKTKNPEAAVAAIAKFQKEYGKVVSWSVYVGKWPGSPGTDKAFGVCTVFEPKRTIR